MIIDVMERAKWGRAGWMLLGFGAVVNGLEGLRYALPSAPFHPPIGNFVTRQDWLAAHALFSSVALLAGPWQFSTRLRQRYLHAHRWLGRIYCAAVAAGWVSSLPIAAHAETGAVASAGFLALGVFWMGTTAAGYFAIRAGRVQAHRDWMVRSYAMAAAAITLRVYLPVVLAAHASFAIGYSAIAWMCWVPNLLVAEWLVRQRRAMRVAAW